jgi:hypothetical protein
VFAGNLFAFGLAIWRCMFDFRVELGADQEHETGQIKTRAA